MDSVGSYCITRTSAYLVIPKGTGRTTPWTAFVFKETVWKLLPHLNIKFLWRSCIRDRWVILIPEMKFTGPILPEILGSPLRWGSSFHTVSLNANTVYGLFLTCSLGNCQVCRCPWDIISTDNIYYLVQTSSKTKALLYVSLRCRVDTVCTVKDTAALISWKSTLTWSRVFDETEAIQ